MNMAVDEWLLGSQRALDSPPVLRIYFWDRPSYSIGYFQKVAQKNIPIVRRITGGGRVCHGSDLTFSLTLKNPNCFLPNDAKSSYLRINEVLLAAFKPIYPKLDFTDCKTVPSGRGVKERNCFDLPSCYDLMLDGKKVVGSSQRRQNGALLHQSSVFLSGDRLTLTAALRRAFQEKWQIKLIEAPLNKQELEKVRLIELQRYGSPAWAIDSRTR